MYMRRLNLELSEEAYETLEMLRQRMDKTSKAEVLRSAVALLQLAASEKAKGKKLAILNGDEKVDARIEII
jgi:DNA polymerase II large subunit